MRRETKKTFFISGTDTDVGKTLVAAGLLYAASAKGLTTAAIKPVAAGCEQTEDGLRNSDALMLQEAATLKLSYQQINSVALQPAIAPHIAAEEAGQRLQATRITGFCRGVLMQGADFTVIEGAGGWRVPLNGRETVADIAIELNTPVVLVVAMKLGCINHALLTAEAIRRDGLPLAGWVANRVDAQMSRFEENLATLQSLLPAPLLGVVPHLENPDPQLAANHLDIEPLLSAS
ncbi:dethiobiotin synthase [Porticoccus sp. W117]|uniref:dethiobiotin synthase n=1 Tax=Porticoccus sp. W117 TaxID=3054777 RepID=UPI002591B24B|nr:dethiobiotin synthase [Porticoccus sp. W117]MDM3870713.1 dethiobiotin synthase [Porticoccus sp. W117]